jgi:hypothetical protein
MAIVAMHKKSDVPSSHRHRCVIYTRRNVDNGMVAKRGIPKTAPDPISGFSREGERRGARQDEHALRPVISSTSAASVKDT